MFLIHLQYTIREAAKAAGLWDKAPYMEEISPQAFRAYFDYVSIEILV